ncbi:uncharacterized protein F4807DRAFT_459176 [Annulohypoxylon truncatum]|uniref:uncharacterized protein n=1 Tax=Annulohypoxylon truncatum TaxID=327061 RepID=UPI002008E303|nr:uncharacterized protein F4807DRAFT_459176 [Annulohypoxylon truncatum]KAI1210948.1 hypothetical protein F4807DRAFT_459176 [Annulohypoxylon truncatum]
MSDSQTKAKPTNPKSPLSEPGDDQQGLWNFLIHEGQNKEKQIIPRADHYVAHDSANRHEYVTPSRSSPPSTISKKATEVAPTKPTQPPPVPHEVLLKRRVNGVWDSCHANDLTVHLALSAQEDLDESLEEFCRLQRLGHFTSAREFFTENLREHMERPQVLIGYAELLLEQGDYNTLSEIDDGTMCHACDSLVDGDDRRLLTIYWKLIKVLSVHYKPDRPRVFSTKREVIEAAVDEFHAVVTANKGSITSTEVKILALFYRLCSFIDDSAIPQRLQEVFPPEFHEGLYVALLRDGRVWDLRDIAVAGISSRVGATEYWGNTRKFIKDWSRMTTDTSTTLALLDILVSQIVYELEHSTGADDSLETIMRQSEPLALSIIENDPENMKSRSFMRWMLAKAQSIDVKGPHYARSYGEQLQSWPGLVFHSRRLQLPQYVPLQGENPGWKVNSAAPRFERPVRLARKISKELGDYQTEVIALQRLILLSANPDEEFEELCNLQSLTQGDVCGYSKTLVSKYLISNTDDLKQDLKLDISRLFDIPHFSDSISMLDSWILNMLQYCLEGEGPAAQQALEGADEDYQDLPWAFRVKIDKKFPTIQGRVGRLMHRSPSPKLESRFNRQRQERQGTREEPEVVYCGPSEDKKHPTTKENDDLGQKKDGKGMELTRLHPTRRISSPKSSEEDEWVDDSYESEDWMTKTYAPKTSPAKRPTAASHGERRSVSFLPRSRKGGPGLAPGESPLSTSRATTSIFDQSKEGSGIAISSNQSTKPNSPISQSRYKQSAVSGQGEEVKQLDTLDKSELIEYLQNKRPNIRMFGSSPKIISAERRNADTEREKHQRRGKAVVFTKESESSHPFTVNEKLEVKEEGYKEHDRATVDDIENKGLEPQGQSHKADNEQTNEEKETHAQEAVEDVKQKDKARTHEDEEPQILEAGPAVATVESTEDLGENREGTTSPTIEIVD